jgi:hypothetical protein
MLKRSVGSAYQVAAAETPKIGPHVDRTPNEKLHKETGVFPNEIQRLLPLMLHVFQFADLLKFRSRGVSEG